MAKDKKEITFQKPKIYTLEEFNQEAWSQDTKNVRERLLDMYFRPWKLEITPSLCRRLDELDKYKGSEEKVREKLIENAKYCAEVHSLVTRPWASEPMSDDTKEKLREINNSKKVDISSKYAWAVPGSTRFDKDRNESLTDVKCEKCGDVRSVISRQTYQMKLCKKCK